ncbi:MAG: ribosome hibernation-promoting factor, HPF/YfiA family [Thermoanaerobaculia bacterium]
MSLEITGRHIDVPPREKQRVEERLTRLEKHTGRIDDARFVVTGEKHRVLAEAIIASGRETWKAREESGDLPTALVSVLDKIESQAKRDRARRKDHKGKMSAREAATEWEVEVIAREEFRSPPQDRRIVKTTRIPIKPMSAEEAAFELEDSLHEFIVFQDASSDRVSVLYKRRDGNFGLIAPEW